MPLLTPPSTTATIDSAAISAVGSIPPSLLLTTTAIAAVEDRHCCCHTVNDKDRQKPAVVGCHRWQQWRSLLTEAAVDGSCGDGGLCRQGPLSTEAAVGCRVNDALASAGMVSLTNGGGSDGHCCC
jgi:hypothetical protein